VTLYEIRHYRDANDRYVLIAICCSLEAARELRKVSGDLVVDSATDVVVADPQWLWEWERSPRSYASQNLGRYRPGSIVGLPQGVRNGA